MPEVGGVKYPYTKKGRAAAQRATIGTGGARPREWWADQSGEVVLPIMPPIDPKTGWFEGVPGPEAENTPGFLERDPKTGMVAWDLLMRGEPGYDEAYEHLAGGGGAPQQVPQADPRLALPEGGGGQAVPPMAYDPTGPTVLDITQRTPPLPTPQEEAEGRYADFRTKFQAMIDRRKTKQQRGRPAPTTTQPPAQGKDTPKDQRFADFHAKFKAMTDRRDARKAAGKGTIGPQELKRMTDVWKDQRTAIMEFEPRKRFGEKQGTAFIQELRDWTSENPRATSRESTEMWDKLWDKYLIQAGELKPLAPLADYAGEGPVKQWLKKYPPKEMKKKRKK